MRKLFFGIFIVVVAILLALWSPWMKWDFDFGKLLGVGTKEEIASLYIYSLAGEMQIYLDGELQGEVADDSSPFIIDRVEAGDRLVSLRRITSDGKELGDVSKVINFVEGTTVVFSYQIGVTDEFTQGHDIYAIPKSDQSKESRINFFVNVPDVQVQIDEIPAQTISENRLTEILNFDTQHKIVVSKNGYETLEFIILPETQEERNKLKSYDINVDIQLMVKPVTVQ